MLLTLIPAAMVIVQPDLGSGLVYIVIGLATLFVAGTGWRHFAALFALGRGRDRTHSRGRAEGRA